MTQQIVLASNNAGKIREIMSLLQGNSYEILPQSDFTDSDVDETGLTFIENAILKARFASQSSGLPAIADDSGLEVDALGGEPGVFSARFSGVKASDLANNDKLIEALKGVPDEKRTARFRCVMVYMRHAKDPSPLIAQGVWEGLILQEPRGLNGFGYDPLFFVPEMQCSSAELAPHEKNKLSHRGKALNALIALLK